MSMDATRKWLLENTRNRFTNPQRAYSLVDAALSQFPTLQPKISEFVADDGVRQALLCLHGTLPVVFNGATFNIPVVFWFPRGFPEHSPLAYVTPTRAMVVKVGKHVDERGRVYHPYLASWSGRSTLSGLFSSLISVFSMEPPVFSRPPGHTGMAINLGPSQPRPPAGSVSMMTLPQSTSPSTAALPVAGAMSMSSLPQMGPASHGQGVRPSPPAPLSSAFVRPAASAANEPSSVNASPAQRPQVSDSANASIDSVEQSLGKMAVESENTGTAAPADGSAIGTQPQQPQQPQQQTEQAQEQAQPPAPTQTQQQQQQQQTYHFNPVTGRPPIPALHSAGTSPRLDTAAGGQTSPRARAGSGASAEGSPVVTATASFSTTQQQPKKETPPPALQPAESASTAAATPTTAAGMVSNSSAAATPKSSLLDYEPMDDEQKRLVGYQLAIYNRVTAAVNKSREKHTRVNKELLDQSANLNSGAGVIAEERQQLLESQRQLSANISVLENKLNELNEKKAEFPDGGEIADVRRVFCGQTRPTEQLFDLAGEIAAIDDTLYFLGKALSDGRVPLTTYMRQVRKLAQQQFMAKALALKIRELSSLDR
ncbi:suppressor protein stp22 of temperature-sensitive alpha-factor receptor and arginine permease [Coemansia sp. RSA 552]|nr:suppressor protein stp22 of temperature-sensitive alpha-factor receptor and arginine permease [Coemansia sp. RSA 552]